MSKKSSWIVTLNCSVTKEVVCKNCTEEEASSNPWDYAIDEREIEQTDWEVDSIKENI